MQKMPCFYTSTHTTHTHTHTHMSLYVKLEGSTGWQICIECLEMQVSFRKRAANNRSLLQQTPCKDKACCASSPPCTSLQQPHSLCVCVRVATPLFSNPTLYQQPHLPPPWLLEGGTEWGCSRVGLPVGLLKSGVASPHTIMNIRLCSHHRLFRM